MVSVYITASSFGAVSSEVLTDLNLVLDEVENMRDIRVVIDGGQVIRHLLQGLILGNGKCLQFKPSNT